MEGSFFDLCLGAGGLFIDFDYRWYCDAAAMLMYGSKGGITKGDFDRMTNLEIDTFRDSFDDLYKRMREAQKNPNSIDTGNGDDAE